MSSPAPDLNWNMLGLKFKRRINEKKQTFIIRSCSEIDSDDRCRFIQASIMDIFHLGLAVRFIANLQAEKKLSPATT